MSFYDHWLAPGRVEDPSWPAWRVGEPDAPGLTIRGLDAAPARRLAESMGAGRVVLDLEGAPLDVGDVRHADGGWRRVVVVRLDRACVVCGRGFALVLGRCAWCLPARVTA